MFIAPPSFFCFPHFIYPDERLRQLEEKVRRLEQEKAVASCANSPQKAFKQAPVPF